MSIVLPGSEEVDKTLCSNQSPSVLKLISDKFSSIPQATVQCHWVATASVDRWWQRPVSSQITVRPVWPIINTRLSVLPALQQQMPNLWPIRTTQWACYVRLLQSAASCCLPQWPTSDCTLQLPPPLKSTPHNSSQLPTYLRMQIIIHNVKLSMS